MRHALLTSLAMLIYAQPVHAMRPPAIEEAEKVVKEKASMVYEVPSLPESCSTSPFGEVCQHMFGGRRTRIAMPSVPGEACANPVQLYQLSERLAAPVGNPEKQENCGVAEIDIPYVRERTYFRLSKMHPGADDTADSAHDEVIAVYPENGFAELKEWSEENRLIIHDTDRKLTPLLDKQAIAYSTTILPATTKLRNYCIWLPSSEDDEPSDNCTASLVLHERTETLPMVINREVGGRHQLEVYMTILPSLSYHPLTQRMFLELITYL